MIRKVIDFKEDYNGNSGMHLICVLDTTSFLGIKKNSKKYYLYNKDDKKITMYLLDNKDSTIIRELTLTEQNEVIKLVNQFILSKKIVTT